MNFDIWFPTHSRASAAGDHLKTSKARITCTTNPEITTCQGTLNDKCKLWEREDHTENNTDILELYHLKRHPLTIIRVSYLIVIHNLKKNLPGMDFLKI